MAIPRLFRAQARRAIERPKINRRDQFRTLPLPADRVLFLGDSITEQGMWHEWFPELPTLNRGIGGETVAEVRARLDTAVNRPLAVSLLVGTNDLTGFGSSTDPAAITRQFDELLSDLQRQAADAPIIVTAVLPRHRSYSSAVGHLNAGYHAIADQHGTIWLDLADQLADATGALRSEYTADALHLNGAGYEVWTRALRPHLERAVRADA